MADAIVSGMLIRDARMDDLAAINGIYNHYVLTSTCTLQLDPSTHAERAEWFLAHGGRYPVVVAETDGEVVGWASLSPYHVRPGYRPAVEDSVYVHHDRRARGVGGKLLAELLGRATLLGHHTVIGMIAADERPSLALHERFRFEKVGHLREVGEKLGRRVDVVFMQRMLRS